MTAPEQAPDDREPTTTATDGSRWMWVWDKRAGKVQRIWVHPYFPRSWYAPGLNTTLDARLLHDTRSGAESDALAYIDNEIERLTRARDRITHGVSELVR